MSINLTQSSCLPVIFCDFDGPIVDVSERYYQTYRQGLSSLAAHYEKTTGQSLATRPLKKQLFWQLKQDRMPDLQIAITSGVPEEWFQTYITGVEKLVNHPGLLKWDQLQPTVKDAFCFLEKLNVCLVLVTLRHPRQVEEFLNASRIRHHVQAIYGTNDVNAAHQNRVEQKCRLLENAIAQQRQQGFRTEQSWMIGDTEADIIAARSVGISSAAVTCGVRSRNYLQTLRPTQLYTEMLSAVHAVVDKTPAFQAA